MIDKALKRFDPMSLITLLSTACDSAYWTQRNSSIILLWVRALTNPPHGNILATPKELETLLFSVRKTVPQIRRLEDFVPYDPRHVVRFTVESRRLRIHPGLLTDPLQTLGVLRTTAEAIDDFTLKQRGFNATDMIEVALAYADWRMAQLGTVWASQESCDLDSDNQLPMDSPPESIRDEEIQVVLELNHTSDKWIQSCTHPERAAKAWAWATTQPSSLHLHLEPMVQTLGPVLAVNFTLGLVPIPASLVINAISAAVARFSSEASADQNSLDTLQSYTEQQVLNLLPVAGPLTPLGSQLGIVIAIDKRHVFVFGVASGLDKSSLVRELNGVDAVLATMNVTDTLGNEKQWGPDALMGRIVLYGGPILMQNTWHQTCAYIHISNFTTIVRDIQSAQTNMDLLWQFLIDLTFLQNPMDLISVDFLDIWRHWQRYGVLSLAPRERVVTVVDPTPDDKLWSSATQWEPIERTLSDAHLPEVSYWPWARLDENAGQATLMDPSGNMVLVSSSPPLITVSPKPPILGQFRLDLNFAVGVADGIRITFTTIPYVRDALAKLRHKPIILRVEFAEEKPEVNSESELIRAAFTLAAPCPIIKLVFGPRWLKKLAEAPVDAHGEIGEALAGILSKLDFQDSDDRWILFIESWKSAPPVAMIESREMTLAVPVQGQSLLPRTRSTLGHVNWLLAQRMRDAHIKSTESQGIEAINLCKDRILPLIEEELEKVIETWSDAAILEVAKHLNDAHGERFRVKEELGMALRAPWGEKWLADALDGPEEAQTTRPLEVLLERLLVRDIRGTVCPDRFDIAYVVDMVLVELHIQTTVASAERGLGTLSLKINRFGLFVTELLSNENRLTHDENWAARSRDLEAYYRADRADRLRLGRYSSPIEYRKLAETEGNGWKGTAFISLSEFRPELPKSLIRVNELMTEKCGTSIDALNAILGTAVTWNGSGDDSVVSIPEQALCNAAKDWSHLPESEIIQALHLLSLYPEKLKEERIPAWEIEHRQNRLAIRPLIHFNGEVIIIPRIIAATQFIYSQYLQSGRLPWPPSDVPDSVQNALNQFRQRGNRRLEVEADEIAAGLGLVHRRNIEVNEADSFGLKIQGEIDLLVGDWIRGRIWVCEVKDVSFAFSPGTIRKRVNKFLTDDHYIENLLLRFRAISDNIASTAQMLHAPATSGPWRIIPLMITRTVEPVAFLSDVGVTFTVLDDLASVLCNDVDPAPGHAPIGR
jgi:hypothetical protein